MTTSVRVMQNAKFNLWLLCKTQCLIYDCYVKHVILTYKSFTRIPRLKGKICASKGLSVQKALAGKLQPD